MTILEQVEKALVNLSPDLQKVIAEQGSFASFEAGTELLREGQYVKVIPLVLSGGLKVMADFDERELLLYYIRPSESCALSFSAALHDSPSQIKAICSEDSEVLLIPSSAVRKLTKDYDEFNQLFFDQYQLRYTDLLGTIQSLLFGRMDQRLLDYLKVKSEHLQGAAIKIPHREIARELGTAREVISRVLKKLENEGLVEQSKEGIKVH